MSVVSIQSCPFHWMSPPQQRDSEVEISTVVSHSIRQTSEVLTLLMGQCLLSNVGNTEGCWKYCGGEMLEAQKQSAAEDFSS